MFYTTTPLEDRGRCTLKCLLQKLGDPAKTTTLTVGSLGGKETPEYERDSYRMHS